MCYNGRSTRSSAPASRYEERSEATEGSCLSKLQSRKTGKTLPDLFPIFNCPNYIYIFFLPSGLCMIICIAQLSHTLLCTCMHVHVSTSLATKVCAYKWVYMHIHRHRYAYVGPVASLILKRHSHLNRKEAAVVHVSGRLLKQKNRTKQNMVKILYTTQQYKNNKHRLIKSLSYL